MMEKLILNNNESIPYIGLGTYPLFGVKLGEVILKSILLGYRSFDTSSAYGNEKWLGRGLKYSPISREKLFVTTKLSNSEQRKGDVKSSLMMSLSKLGLDYIDMYLLHWPNPDTYIDCWKQMEELHKEGYIKTIGVANFHKTHLESLLSIANVVPAVNQIEVHPLLSQIDLRLYCKEKNISIQGYTPLARMDKKLIDENQLVLISKKYKKTVPQIILRWDVQNGIPTVPKTSSWSRLKENIDIFDFELTHDEMNTIDSLNVNCRVRYDPDNCDFTKLG